MDRRRQRIIRWATLGIVLVSTRPLHRYTIGTRRKPLCLMPMSRPQNGAWVTGIESPDAIGNRQRPKHPASKGMVPRQWFLCPRADDAALVSEGPFPAMVATASSVPIATPDTLASGTNRHQQDTKACTDPTGKPTNPGAITPAPNDPVPHRLGITQPDRFPLATMG